MALFSLCKKLSFSRTFKIVYSEFHTLHKLQTFSFTKRNLGPSITPKRTFFWIFKKSSKKEIRAKDKPPDPYQLIYRNGIDHYFLVGQYGAFFMSITLTLVAIFNSDKWGDTEMLPHYEGNFRPVNNQMLGLYSGFIFTVCLFYFYLVRMPMRIYYYPQKQKYLMYSYGVVPNQVKKQVLRVADLHPLPNKGLWGDITYQDKKGQKLMLFDNYFRHPADLYVMLGWQKDPIAEGMEKVENKK